MADDEQQATERLGAFFDGFDVGRDQGRREAEAEMQRAWSAMAEQAARPGPSHDELEVLRWGPGGREHFADPRPGDFMGRQAQREPTLDDDWAGHGFHQPASGRERDPDAAAKAEREAQREQAEHEPPTDFEAASLQTRRP